MSKKYKFKKKAELGINETLINKDQYNTNIADSKMRVADTQMKQQGIEDSLSSSISQIAPLGNVSKATTLAGNTITQNAIKSSGDIKKGQYAAGKAIKYGGAGVALGSFDPTGTTSAVLGGIGVVAGATQGLVESSKMERRYKALKKTQDNVDNQFRIGSTVNDRFQSNQAEDGKKSLKSNSRKWKKK